MFHSLPTTTYVFHVEQDMKLQPLSSFLQPVRNEFNAIPMPVWLRGNTTEDKNHRERMKCLGNIVVPASGALGMEILQMMRLQSSSHNLRI